MSQKTADSEKFLRDPGFSKTVCSALPASLCHACGRRDQTEHARCEEKSKIGEVFWSLLLYSTYNCNSKKNFRRRKAYTAQAARDGENPCSKRKMTPHLHQWQKRWRKPFDQRKDEIHLMIGNLVLGEGIPVFAGKPDASLQLIEVRHWEDSDHILACYKVLHKNV
jgi:hypothetical protein